MFKYSHVATDSPSGSGSVPSRKNVRKKSYRYEAHILSHNVQILIFYNFSLIYESVCCLNHLVSLEISGDSQDREFRVQIDSPQKNDRSACITRFISSLQNNKPWIKCVILIWLNLEPNVKL